MKEGRLVRQRRWGKESGHHRHDYLMSASANITEREKKKRVPGSSPAKKKKRGGKRSQLRPILSRHGGGDEPRPLLISSSRSEGGRKRQGAWFSRLAEGGKKGSDPTEPNVLNPRE